MLFESADLPAHLARLYDFEGDGYNRVAVMVEADGASLSTYIYVIAE
jgi:hypothetical protein